MSSLETTPFFCFHPVSFYLPSIVFLFFSFLFLSSIFFLHLVPVFQIHGGRYCCQDIESNPFSQGSGRMGDEQNTSRAPAVVLIFILQQLGSLISRYHAVLYAPVKWFLACVSISHGNLLRLSTMLAEPARVIPSILLHPITPLFPFQC